MYLHSTLEVLGFWFSLVVLAALAYSYEQEVIGGVGGGEDVASTTGTSKYNLTLHVSRKKNSTLGYKFRGYANLVLCNLTLFLKKFDDLATNASGIGYDPPSNSTPLHCSDLYFQSFSVVNVAKAHQQHRLPDPVDLLCATSAPNALFAHRRPGPDHPWPRFSLHPLTNPSLARDPNVTFDMISMSVSPTGNIPQDAMVIVWLNLLKLPPNLNNVPSEGGGRAGRLPFPELSRGAPGWPEGRLYQLIAFFGPGPHPSMNIEWGRFRRQIPRMGTKVDTFEMYAQFFERKGPSEPYLEKGDWEVCLDDVAVEIARKVGREKDDEDEYPRGGSSETELGRMFLFAGQDGDFIDDQERGERLMRELGL
ncbi:uncharacterized protein Z520_04936 [Fonsecaea multimorphosa CBS 102226]|uniref:Uncharacterized protein n=1 Tax=Fonsecaea multimorphosa CBS 102226 TaxID=1442371 RepID=A0A0D2HBU6_9EURO|nr:uncharacterized protein Z520_04936 [Fonsecaea multimorphosa CBS 102226]KIX99360.1 hypothetical protein Z520_04936 [Fonsecaea multimorphosa CBS 102226]OAL25690.1 hypothetical protein AYO22_04679 [Fonsecaea multimorphosa]